MSHLSISAAKPGETSRLEVVEEMKSEFRVSCHTGFVGNLSPHEASAVTVPRCEKTTLLLRPVVFDVVLFEPL
jgi:hypothetical protein